MKIDQLPKNDIGDFLYNLYIFIRTHKRLPLKNYWSDYLFWLKAVKEKKDLLRGYISDKEFVKYYIKYKVGDRFNVKTLKILNNESELNEYEFPNKCVIKPTHMSGEVIIKKENDEINKKKIRKWFNQNYYELGREYNYKFLSPKIIVEPVLYQNDNIRDYKFFCINGIVKLIQVDFDRSENHSRLIYDNKWIKQNYTIQKPLPDIEIEKPNLLKEMIIVAEKIAKDFSFIRVDFYTNEKEFRIGELTNWPGNGGEVFLPKGSEKIASKILFQ